MAKVRNVKGGPNMGGLLDETGDAVTPEEEAELAAEAQGQTPEAEAVAEEVVAEESAKPEKKPKVGEDLVPRDRLNEVLADRDAAKQAAELAAKEAAELREKWARLEERKLVTAEATARAQAAEEEARKRAERPDPDVDPAGARAWDAVEKANRLEQQIAAMTQQIQSGQQVGQQNIQEMQWNMGFNSMLMAARSADPEHDKKVDSLKNVWKNTFVAAGYSPQQADFVVAQTERAIVDGAMRTGKSLNQVVAEMSAQLQIPVAAAPTNGNGQTAPKQASKIQQIQKGQAVQGLGRTQSGETAARQNWQEMDAQEFANFIAEMDEDEFMDRTEDPQSGKEFNARVNALG